MKKLTAALLVGILALVPGMALAQSGGGAGGTKAPSSGASGKSGGTSGSGQSTTGTSPSASPSGSGDTMSKYRTKADCEKAGGMWTASTKTCMAKK